MDQCKTAYRSHNCGALRMEEGKVFKVEGGQVRELSQEEVVSSK